MIDERNYEAVRDLLDDDECFNETIMREISNSRQAMKDLLLALRLLCTLKSNYTNTLTTAWSELYIQAMSGALLESTTITEIFSSTRKLPSDELEDLLDQLKTLPSLPGYLVGDLDSIKTDLGRLRESVDASALPLRSTYAIQHSSLRATIVAQKVSLSRNAAKLSSQDTAFTELVDRTCDSLLTYLQNTLINPSDLFLNEVFIFDSKSPHRDVFTPRPRFAIERALSSPHDYLGCECCSSGEGAVLEASQPATAILYQLYLESGSVTNTADLWEAFWTIVGGADEEEEREQAFTLFSRALAELKYMGMIKNSRKKADHLQKLAWKGL